VAHSASTLYVSFLGTKHLRDLLADLRFWLSPLPGHGKRAAGREPAPALHSGFLARARGVAGDVAALYARARAEGRAMVLCGHSLGAAVAVLATLQLLGGAAGAAGRVRCVGFAAPAVGNAALAALVLRRGWERLFELHSTPEDQVIGFINMLLLRGGSRRPEVAGQAGAGASSGMGKAHGGGARRSAGPPPAPSPAGGLASFRGLLAAPLPSSAFASRMAARPWRLAAAGAAPFDLLAAGVLQAEGGRASGGRAAALDLDSMLQPLLVSARPASSGRPAPAQQLHRPAAAAAAGVRQLPGMLVLWQLLLAAGQLATGALQLVPRLVDSWVPAYHGFGVQFHVTSSGLRRLHTTAPSVPRQHTYTAGRATEGGWPSGQQRKAVRGLVGAAVAKGRGLASLLVGLHPGKLRQLYWQHRMLAYRARISQVAGRGGM
jgi:hypothetical protein